MHLFQAHLSKARRLLAPIVLVATCILSACATLPQKTPSDASDDNWLTGAERFQVNELLSASNSWRYAGKVGISLERGREQASIVWQFRDQSNEVRLFGPLGIGAIKIQFDDYGVVLSDNDGVLHRGSSAQDLLTRIVGWPIPVESLANWLFVTPQEGSSFRYQLNEEGEVAILEQNGWRVRYRDYRLYNQRLMPRKVHATPLPEADLPQVEVKLITREWTW